MKAIVVTDEGAGTAGMTLVERPEPWDGRLRTNIGNVSTLDDAVAALNPTERITGKTVIRVPASPGRSADR
jgi:hypothetical protein